jgi:dolichol-phosphate hexosyltransferase
VILSKQLILIPALNEEEGIGPTLAELRQVLDNPFFLVVDGGSKDNTVAIANEFGAKVLPQKGEGKGGAIADAIMHMSRDLEYVILIDADYTYPAEYIPEMLEILEKSPNVGMVCGNRFNSHLDLGKMHNILYFGNRLIAFLHNLMNGVQLRDPLTGLRVVRWAAIKDWKPKSRSFDIEVELNHQVERRGFTIAEVPIIYRPRLGEKKLKLPDAAVIVKRIISESLY